MRLFRVTYFIGILFPLILLISCSSVPESIQETEELTPELLPRIKKSQVEYQLNNILNRVEFRNTIPSIIVVSADYGDTVYSHKSDILVRPASNQKLFTSVAALRLLGSHYNFRTVIYYTGHIENGILSGNLIIKGYGDPLLSPDDLDELVDIIVMYGISEVHGQIIVDDTFFDDVVWPNGWMWDDAPNPYVPYISALSVNDNVVTLSVERSGNSPENVTVNITPSSSFIQYEFQSVVEERSGESNSLRIEPRLTDKYNEYIIKGDVNNNRLPRSFTVTVNDPALFTGYLLRDKLENRGIKIPSKVVRGSKDVSAIPIAQLNRPLNEVLNAMNKMSHNLAAENTLKTLSAELYGAPGTGKGGIRAVNEALQSLGLDTSLSRIVDGSGVSFYNLTTARTIAEMLFYVANDNNLFSPLHGSLSILGIDGTLMRRAIHSESQGRVHAKTGTLTGVSTFAGYLDTLHGERLIVTMLFQNFTRPSGRYRQIQDEICDILLHYNREASVLSTP